MKWWIKIKSWTEGLAAWTKVLTTIIVFGGLIVGGYYTLRGGIIKSYQEEVQQRRDSTDLQQVKLGLDTVAYSVRMLSEEFSAFRSWEEIRAQETEDQMNRLIQSDRNLQDFLLRHAVDRDEMFEILDIWEVKKNLRNIEDEIVSSERQE